MEKIAERAFPFAAKILFAISIKFININSITNLKDIILIIINFVAILIGFLTTMLSILVTASDKEIMIYIKEKKIIKSSSQGVICCLFIFMLYT